ncbi:hypothetical protein WA026_018407 [Henosepilachna vigintioctopunctata]|uniref:Peptidase aspartic putative domain-containing protein n=1 Tax=Henosepilachna vigintioctopunctata TaxID=420089 RepID=A0AAW1UZZ2_9CUCU
MPGDDEKVLRLRALRELVITSVNLLYQQAEIIKENPELFSNFKIRCRNLEKWKNSFEKHHTAIISILAVQGGTEMTLAAELDIYTLFEEKCQYIETIYYELFELPEENRLTVLSTNPDKSNVNVKLPKINLLTFDGDIKKFPSFISNFNSLIHENGNLSNVEKFNYLTSVLRGPPSNILKNLPIIDDNYPIAYNSLVSRYENKRLLANAYWKEINHFRPITNDRSLRNLLDCFHENLSALKMLTLPVDNWDFILMQMLMERLDYDTLKVFEREYASSEIPTYKELRDILLKHCTVVESVLLNSKTKDKTIYNSKPNMFIHKASFLTNTANKSKNKIYCCIFCKSDHIIFNCPAFISKDPHKRYEIIKNLNACINCLADSHSVINCKSDKRCRTCKKSHHTLLHFVSKQQIIEPRTEVVESLPSNSSNEVKSFSGSISKNNSPFAQVLLSTLKLKIQDSFGKFHIVRAILDSGSQVSFISKTLAKSLNLKPFNASIIVQGLDHMRTSANTAVQCQVHSIHNADTVIPIEAIIIDKICDSVPRITLSEDTKKLFDQLLLADPEYFKSGSVDLLLGADVFPYILQNGKIGSSPGEPVAINTILGWILMGKTNIHRPHSIKTFLMISAEKEISDINDYLRKFWEIEEVPSVICQSPENKFCETYYKESTFRNSSGRYSVSLPFKVNCPDFGDSRYLALKRFHSLESKLRKNPDLYSKYVSAIRDYLKNDHLESIHDSKLHSTNNTFYLPHSYVLRKESPSTPVRIVFDGSSCYPNKISLNDALFTGPKLQSNLISILLHFRIYRFVFCADIRQMYRMIEINSDHRDYLRILWRFSPHEKLQEYRLKTLPFGLNCSPYLAIRTLQQLSNDHPELCMARELIFNNTYVDDISGGDDSMEGALSKIDEIITLCRKGGFELRKWLSNDKRLLENLPATHAVNNVPVLNLNLDSTFQKILGLNWNSSFDCFSFSNLDITPTCTKRSILSCVARIFDPLGYLTPCIISLKILIQTLWCQGKSWDSNPGDDICNKFSKFRKEIHYFSELRIPRYFDSILNHRCDLIGFCDSSESAYCAVVYVRIYYENASKTFFVCAKSKVAPIKKLSIPRLELCAAVLLSKLILFVTNSYENIIKFSNTYAFSDSTVALTWIKSSPHKWKNFVSNRTSYIQDIIPPERWFYVASEHNPADVGTRGISPAALVSCSLWLDGPSSQFIDSENNYEYNSIEYEVINESAKSCLVTYVPEEDFVNVLLYKFSSLPKILRIICYILRFITNLKLESKNERVYTNNAITSRNFIMR